MKKLLLLLFLIGCMAASVQGRGVTIKVVNEPAADVFRSLIAQTGKNFVYSSEILQGVRVTVDVADLPLKDALSQMFAGTDIIYTIKGNNVILKRKIRQSPPSVSPVDRGAIAGQVTSVNDITILDEFVVESRLEAPAVETAEIGAKKITADAVRLTPALFGEADVIKALQLQAGVSEGTEGLAGMHVHGGNADENLYMLDNIPLYQVNHFAGLFSAFNTDLIRYIDFFKSSMPAKYDGRLSSFMDVRLLNGRTDGHHGSARLGLTSGAFNISGPIGQKTTYIAGIRRSWYDILTIPMLAIINSTQEEDTRLHYYFMDLNAKITHRFSDKAAGFVSIYFGDDMLKTGYKDDSFDGEFIGSVENDKYDFHWGNLVTQTGLNYRISNAMNAEFTAAYTRYFSSMRHHEVYKSSNGSVISTSENWMKTANNINDWIFRGDFDWVPNDINQVRFGVNYVRHSFLPARTSRITIVESTRTESRDSTWTYGANEFNAYIEDDWKISDRLRVNAGLHTSVFGIDHTLKHGISPRLSLSYRPADNIAIKGAYSRTTQYVHQLTESYLSLPTDQWIPVNGKFKPQTADKIAAGAYWESSHGYYSLSVEGYYKWMHNLLEYRDEYYLKPPFEMWDARLTSGHGTSKGIDIVFEKLTGKLTGHISYSLAWADRTFADKNRGQTFPARFDNRHTINLLVNWHINSKVQLNASWTGHSGNRFTLMPQMWESPSLDESDWSSNDETPLRTSINNYQLPFYHRLDLSCTVRNRRGYWTFGLYNAYNHANTIAIKRGTKEVWENTPYGVCCTTYPTFQKVKLLPIIPSISYTWEF